ncbi:hypothetical protein [Nitratireductor soli]|uniref:hypothetical protein n=1 Tax=Nitratireductor soli TaxID=1670619 RepID=UPI00065E2876|nr:hypothetical protein [Nitratireductor soli]
MLEQQPLPANIAPYVEALGTDDAVRLFLSVGGSDIYLPRRSSPRSLAARAIGPDRVDRLAQRFGYGYIKVPLARQWVASVMKANGASLAEIARTVRADVATVRRWLGPAEDHRQIDLFS